MKHIRMAGRSKTKNYRVRNTTLNAKPDRLQLNNITANNMFEI